MYLFILLALSSLSFASDIRIGYTNSNSLILRGSSCQTLLENREAICSWKESLDKEFSRTNKGQNCISEGPNKFKIIVNECLPKFTKEMHHKKLYKSGANCWGTAMSFKDISLKPRFIWSEEMMYLQKSNICRKLEPNEKMLPGDIINIYGPEYIFSEDGPSKGTAFWEALFPGRLTSANIASGYSGFHNFLHSETYITDELTFGKDSPNFDDRFGFHEMKEVYGRSRDKDCQENNHLSPWIREFDNAPKSIRGSKCDYFSNAYRCTSLRDYIESEKLNDEQDRIKTETEYLLKIQERLFGLLKISNFKLTQREINDYIYLADNESDLALESLKENQNDKVTELLLTWKYFSAEAIRKSLELANLVEPTERL